jgi:serine/threonine-protein kinase
MEYLPGLSLQELAERYGPLPPQRVIYLLRQACGALHEAHQVGLIHRDLKPPNIFAAYRGGQYDVAKLLDFGLVKPTKDEESPVLTREGAVTGSPLYMAPEQIMRTHPADARTDIYGMGAIAYFLLTGKPPFAGTDAMEVMIAHARDPVTPPSRVREGVPSDLEDVVMRCLEKDPGRRFQDAESLGIALSSCLDAGAWSAQQAAAWWQSHEPSVAATEAGDSHQEEATTALHGDDETPTLTARAVEMTVDPVSSATVDLSLSVAADEAGPEVR